MNCTRFNKGGYNNNLWDYKVDSVSDFSGNVGSCLCISATAGEFATIAGCNEVIAGVYLKLMQMEHFACSVLLDIFYGNFKYRS